MTRGPETDGEVLRATDDAIGDLLCFATYSANQAFAFLYRRVLQDLRLTYPQYLVMRLLWSRDERTVSGLGAALNLKSNTLTPLLKRLEALGYLVRRRDREDERSVRICLTAFGRELGTHSERITACMTEATGLSAQEIVSLTDTLHRLQHSLLRATGEAIVPQPQR